jgi:hypothetical protein
MDTNHPYCLGGLPSYGNGPYAPQFAHHCGCAYADQCPGDTQVCVRGTGCKTCGETYTDGQTCKNGMTCNQAAATCGP